jgi:hypothetical protein
MMMSIVVLLMKHFPILAPDENGYFALLAVLRTFMVLSNIQYSVVK